MEKMEKETTTQIWGNLENMKNVYVPETPFFWLKIFL